jgi:hypothetical protein
MIYISSIGYTKKISIENRKEEKKAINVKTQQK